MEYVSVSDLICLTWCPQGSFILLKVVRFCPFWRLNDTPLCEYGNFLTHSRTDGCTGHFHSVCSMSTWPSQSMLLKRGRGGQPWSCRWITPSSGAVGAHGVSGLPFPEHSLTHCLHSSASPAQDFPLLRVLASIYSLSFWSYPFGQRMRGHPLMALIRILLHFTFTEWWGAAFNVLFYHLFVCLFWENVYLGPWRILIGLISFCCRVVGVLYLFKTRVDTQTWLRVHNIATWHLYTLQIARRSKSGHRLSPELLRYGLLSLCCALNPCDFFIL